MAINLAMPRARLVGTRLGLWPSATPRASPRARTMARARFRTMLASYKAVYMHFCRVFYSHERSTKRGKARQSLMLG